MVYDGYYKVMSNIPKMGHLPTPVKSIIFDAFTSGTWWNMVVSPWPKSSTKPQELHRLEVVCGHLDDLSNSWMDRRCHKQNGQPSKTNRLVIWRLQKYRYVSMYLCIHVSMFLCSYVSMKIYVSMYLSIHVCIHVSEYPCIYVCMYLCNHVSTTYVSMYLCIHVPMYLCIYVSMYPCTYVPVYLCIYESMYPCTYVPVYLCIYVSM